MRTRSFGLLGTMLRLGRVTAFVCSGRAVTVSVSHHREVLGSFKTPEACSFCSNVSLAADHALQTLGARRVAIVDIDVHHGNGTEEVRG